LIGFGRADRRMQRCGPEYLTPDEIETLIGVTKDIHWFGGCQFV
jgi:hypothetical protein